MRIKEKLKNMSKVDICRLAGFFSFQLACFASMVYFLILTDWVKAAMCVICMMFLCIPEILQRAFKFRIQTALYFFILFYAICPMLGFSYKFYYLFSWWDDLLHGFGGVVFAMFGAFLPKAINKKAPCSLALCALFGFVFSVAASAVWEFIEFGTDTIFKTDMQKDVLLMETRPSYLLGELMGLPIDQMGNLGAIDTLIINNTPLAGYIDVGLIDTMTDMIVETAGALVYTIIYIAGKGKFFVFLPLRESNPKEHLDEQLDNPNPPKN